MSAKFKACIKKIEIYNKVLSGSCEQCIKVILGDIELTNENLIELRKYQPDQPVEVAINSVQVNTPPEEELSIQDNEEESFSLEEDQEEPPEGSVLKVFNL